MLNIVSLLRNLRFGLLLAIFVNFDIVFTFKILLLLLLLIRPASQLDVINDDQAVARTHIERPDRGSLLLVSGAQRARSLVQHHHLLGQLLLLLLLILFLRGRIELVL